MSHDAKKNALANSDAEGAKHVCPVCNRTCTSGQVKKSAITGTRRILADDVAHSMRAALSRHGAIQRWADRLGIARQDAQKFLREDGPRVAGGDIEGLPPLAHAAYHFDRLESAIRAAGDDAELRAALRQGARQLLAALDASESPTASLDLATAEHEAAHARTAHHTAQALANDGEIDPKEAKVIALDLESEARATEERRLATLRLAEGGR